MTIIPFHSWVKAWKIAFWNIFCNNIIFISYIYIKLSTVINSYAINVGTLPPHIMLHIESLIKPITVYGSEVWGYNKTAQSETDKISTWVNLGGMSCTIAGPRAWFRHVQSGSPRENTLFRNTEFEFKIFHFASQTVSQPSARTYLVV